MQAPALRRGDVVEVKMPREIQALLDDRGMLDGVPFMPEMVKLCGRRFVVDARADKICETIYAAHSRRMPDTVLLEDLRCDGSAHGGCQAECRFFWKEAWLRRVDYDSAPLPEVPQDDSRLLELTERTATIGPPTDTTSTTYRCQATEHFRASQRLHTWDPRPYLREYLSGNVGLWRFLRVTARAAIEEPLRKLGLKSWRPLRSARSQQDVLEPALNLRPGELVQVRTRAETARTLSPEDGTHRGIWYDNENLQFCGGRYRVRQRVKRYINERSGQMTELESDYVTLETVKCTGDYSMGRWFCPRNFYVPWSEGWLRRVND